MGRRWGRSVMAKPLIAAFVLAATGLLAGSARAAELGVPGPGVQAAECWPCGPCHVFYTYHPELRTTYGVGFDPRNYDTTEPHFYYGPVRAWPHYWCQNAVYVGKGKAPLPVEAPLPVVTK
jgi:hypothetical protein